MAFFAVIDYLTTFVTSMGILYIVPTPVGNLEDMTMRAIRILKEVDLILAEDTRTSGILLKHFDIKNRLMSHHKFNEHGTADGIVERLKTGQNVALISDAGTPGISDPGFYLAREAANAGIEVQTLPGPTACIPAIVSSGLPCDRFCFEGFLPQKKGRQTRLLSLQAETRTMVFYESPYRLLKTLQQFAEFFGEERQVSVAREISKVHEEHVRGSLKEVIEHFTVTEPRGEIVIVLAGADAKANKKNKGINNMKQFLLLVAGAFMLTLTGCKQGKPQSGLADMAQTDSLQRIIAQKDDEVNDMMATLNEIQEGFREINEAENRVSIVKDGEGANKSQQIRENIQFISQTMKRNRELIAKLRNQVSQSSMQGTQMQSTIENLVKQLDEKDQQLQQLRAELDAKDIHISELDETINNLNTNVNNLASESNSKSQTISAQDKQLNTAWYVFGTKKELKEQRILDDGKVLQANFNKSYFTKIDIRVDNTIKLYSKSAKVMTTHPSSSYTLTTDANKQYVLRITNPNLFWSTSKYLVILVK